MDPRRGHLDAEPEALATRCGEGEPAPEKAHEVDRAEVLAAHARVRAQRTKVRRVDIRNDAVIAAVQKVA